MKTSRILIYNIFQDQRRIGAYQSFVISKYIYENFISETKAESKSRLS